MKFEVMKDNLVAEEETTMINHFTIQLRNSGYCHKQAREIVTSAMKDVVTKRRNRENEAPKRRQTGAELGQA